MFDTENWKDASFRVGVIYDGQTYATFQTPESMVGAMRSKRYHGCWFVAHNLAYDLQNLFGRDIDAELCLINRAVYFARMCVKETERLRDGRSSVQREYVTLVDSTRHYPAALAKIAKLLGREKLFTDAPDLDLLSSSEILARCQSDCEILFSFVSDLQVAYNALGTSYNTTIGSSTMELFRREYQTKGYLQIEEPDLIELNKSYFGGRCEAFFVGEIPPGEYAMGDVNSMYPSVMRGLVVGTPDRRNVWRRNNPPRWTLTRPGSSLVRILVPRMMYPPLPYKEAGNEHSKLIFPCGTLEGWWTHSEIAYALEQGCSLIKHKRAIWFDETEEPFTRFVDDLYAMKLEGGWKELIAKLLLNNLYGKFQQCRSPGRLLPHHDYLRMCAEHPQVFDQLTIVKEMRDPKTGNVLSVLVQPKGMVFPKHSNQHWGSEITAHARIKLHRLLIRYDALYCDTDSVLFRGSLPKSTQLGDLSLKQTVTSALLRGPKAYWLRGEENVIRVKGVPNRPGFMMTGSGVYVNCDDLQRAALEGKQVAFDAPLKLMESFRKRTLPVWGENDQGERVIVDDAVDAKSNFWYPHRKALRFENDKRTVPPGGGWTQPLIINEESNGKSRRQAPG